MSLRHLLLSCITSLVLLIGTGPVLVQPAYAQVNAGLNEVGETIKLPSTDPRVIAVRIINVALGLIGIILVSLIIYAGFLYMTSGGDEHKISKAKKIITNAIIGLIIILSSWAFTKFVIEKLLQATQEGGGLEGQGQGFGQGFGQGQGADAFHVKSITPSGNVPIKNVQVKIIFNKAVDEKSVGSIVVSKVGGATVGGSLTVDGSVVAFTPAQACPAPNQDKKCFDGDSDFVVTVGGSVKSAQGQTVNCAGFGWTCKGNFHTGNLVDTQPPSVSMTFPTDGMKVQQNFLQDVQAAAADDSGIAMVKFFDGATTIDVDAPATSTPKQFSAQGVWDTAGVLLGAHLLSAEAADIDTNIKKSNAITVMVKPEHCFNGKQDADKGETGIDCGGDQNSQDYCGACAGQACSKNQDCSSGFCLNGKCVDKPVIKSVKPLNGKPGTFVTLQGVNFGFQIGTVKFLGAPGPQDDKLALPPQACVDAGTPTWTNTEVIVAVPDAAPSGPLELTNASSKLTDLTNDGEGPSIPNFLVDNSEHPGVCAIQPNSGTVGSQASLIGQGFGGAPQKVLFGKNELSAPFPLWSETKVTFSVPVVNSAPYAVSLKTQAGESNPVSYTVVDKNLGAPPELSALDPTEGPKQQYVTLFGKNFGFSIGVVVFTDGNGQEAIGDTSFPEACAAGFWKDDRIVVKVPSKFKNGPDTQDGKYQVKVKRPDLKESNTLEFTVNSKLPVTPGICAIQPSLGPVGTLVKVFGDKFGAEKPTVTFHPNQLALINAHANQSIETKVPAGAQTGPVQVKVQNQSSNKINFQVKNCNESLNACSPNEFCCPTGECKLKNETCEAKPLAAEFAWKLSTGLIPVAPYVIEQCQPELKPAPTPSPSPWLNRPGGDQAPIDSVIVMRFSKLLEPSSVTSKSFHVYKCTSGSGEPCTTKQEVGFTLAPLTQENGSQHVVKLTPQPMLATGTTYLVTVGTVIKASGPGGVSMDVMKSCGTGPGNETYGYCFRFKTRASSELSKVGNVTVIPSPLTMHGAGETANYQSLPFSADDACIVLDCKQFDWDWYTGSAPNNQDPRASITNTKQNGKGICEQLGTGHLETGEVPVDVTAKLLPNGITGVAKLFVNFIPPYVEAYAPNCSTACMNAFIWARFSSALDEKSVTLPGNIEIRKCKNENCVEAELFPPLNPQKMLVTLEVPFKTQGEKPRQIMIDTVTKNQGQPLLEAGQFYRVLLKGGPNVPNGIKGLNGVPMTGLNHPLGFQWKFRVKLAGEGAICKAETVEVVPVEKYETTVNARQLFVATPFGKPDECSVQGQALIHVGGASWKSSKPSVADLYTINASLIDTGALLPLGCTGKCLATGALAQFGKVAVCGNGVIETTDVHYCVNGKTPKGDACTLMAAGAKAGEECEPSIDGGACDATTCLWLPVKAVSLGGTCGNGKVDVAAGEACDFGPTCVGASNATSSPPVAEFAPCGAPNIKAACEQAGGVCAMHEYRGCSVACRHLGAAAGKTTCGNSDFLGDGKDCDDGNTTDGDGCSAMCLHEPSQPNNQLSSICGNGKIEPGEACEGGIGCDAKTCLHTGTIACANPQDQSCCGNAKIESGEDCDDGNAVSGDACSVSCVFEGSSVIYSNGNKLAPSFCGNGILEKGEQCDAGISSDLVAKDIAQNVNPLGKGSGKGDSFIDRSQLAFIVGNDVPDPNTLKMSTELTANVESKDGKALYGLQCGFTDEASCLQYGAEYGLDSNGCCALRPKVTTPYPKSNGVCRNVQIKGTFNESMDVGSVVNNFEIAQLVQSNTCPSGTTEVLADAQMGKGMWNWMKQLWHRVVAWARGDSAFAAKWCKGGVTGQLVPVGTSTSTKVFVFTLDHALESNTTYRVRFMGDNSTLPEPLTDNADLSKRWGVKTSRGVVSPFVAGDVGDLMWTFTTNDKICAVNVVGIADVTKEPPPPEVAHPYLFMNKGNVPETRDFQAEAQSIQNNMAIPLSPVAEYSWKWAPWVSSDESLVTVISKQSQNSSSDVANATSKQKNGNAILTATLKITNDQVSIPSTTGQTIQGVAPVSVLICENPWPKLTSSPFRDKANSLSANDIANKAVLPPGDPFGGSYFNFSTMYCRDAGSSNTIADDLPALNINLIPKTELDAQKNILRQYLFTYPLDTENTPPAYKGLQQDGIGIRIIANPQHYSPEEWYRSQGFTGSPKSVSVDGYPAIQDGSTVYVAGSNRPQEKQGPIYSNIYLISHNPDAKQPTLQIYDQMVKYLAMNINITGQSNVCVTANGEPFTSTQINSGLPIHCAADWECFQTGAQNLHCDSLKLKLTRDTQRMADFQSLTRRLEQSKDPQGRFPQVLAGSYLQNFTNSLWSSWDNELGKALGTQIPQDPVNRFLSCGRCSKTQLPCQRASDCPAVEGAAQTCQGGKLVKQNNAWTWQVDEKIDPETCWNQEKHQFLCPNLTPEDSPAAGASRFYQYRSLTAGTRYDLGSEFEIPPQSDLSNWWSPPLPIAAFRCVTTSTAGVFCANNLGNGPDDYLCRPCPNPNQGQCKTCQSGAKQGQFCTDATKVADCGAGVNCADTMKPIQGACRQFGGTYTYTDICKNIPHGEGGTCGDGVINDKAPNAEVCEIGMTKTVLCQDGKSFKQLACDPKDCKSYIDDVQHPGCYAGVQCGNGKIDKACGANPAKPCNTNSDCQGNAQCVPVEKCDDGPLNGTYGHCLGGNSPSACQGYAGYCGDGQLSPGEVCDNGNADPDAGNGVWHSAFTPVPDSCALDCKGPGPYCGNGTVDGPEQCDGEVQATSGKICSKGKIDALCVTDADCDSGQVKGQCGGTPQTDSCVGKIVNGYETQHTRSCWSAGKKVNNKDVSCTWNTWSVCQPKGSCGDGMKDPNEECDDGTNNGDNKACLLSCKKNVCGDGKLNTDIEECDSGVDNGKITCSADYDSMCLSCSKLCKFQATAGGYCGDKVKNGPEQCDGPGSVSDLLTCQSLGFDYASSFTKIRRVDETGTKPCTIVKDNSYDVALTLEPKGSPDWKKWYDVTLFEEAGVKLTADFLDAVTNGDPSPIPGLGYDCPRDNFQDAPKFEVTGGKVTCGASCSFSGCQKCSDVAGKGMIRGRVYDALFQQVVPSARVSLVYKGIKVDEVYTDGTGTFTFKTLNTNNACGAYRIVIDMYQDNVCTGNNHDGVNCLGDLVPPWTYPYDLDEGVWGGYFPFTSEQFQVDSFDATVGTGKDADGVAHIGIFPRPEKGKAYAAMLWKSPDPKQTFHFHMSTVLPKSHAFMTTDFTKANPETTTCDYDARLLKNGEVCARDVTWRSYLLGSWDLQELPYARSICIHRAGEKTSGLLNKKTNGCPFEGTKICLDNHPTNKNLVPKLKTADCKSGNLSQAEAEMCNECGADVSHDCSEEPMWESCFQTYAGPIASYVNYAPMYAQPDPVKFFLVGTYSGVSSFTNTIKSSTYKFTAYLATTNEGGSQLSVLEAFKTPPSGQGYVWYLASLDPKTGSFAIKNDFLGTDADQKNLASAAPDKIDGLKPASGLAAFRYWYQGSGPGNYCVKKGDATKLNPDGAVCYQKPEKDACTGTYACGNLDPKTYSLLNF